jgi:predicted PurR-regulated permease PerM
VRRVAGLGRVSIGRRAPVPPGARDASRADRPDTPSDPGNAPGSPGRGRGRADSVDAPGSADPPGAGDPRGSSGQPGSAGHTGSAGHPGSAGHVGASGHLGGVAGSGGLGSGGDVPGAGGRRAGILPRWLRRSLAAQAAGNRASAQAERDAARDGDGPPVPPSPASVAEEHIPVALRVSAGWSWRLIITGAAIYILLMAIGRVRVVVIPLIAGLLIAALIHPLAHRFQRMGVPRLGAAFAALFVFFVVLAGAAVAVGFNAADELPTVTDQVSQGVEQVRGYLTNGPFHLSQSQLDDLVDDIRRNLAHNRGKVVSGVISGASVAAEVITGLLVTLFSTFFFLYDGDRIWNWIVTRFPLGARDRVRGAGREAWFTITGYVRGTVFVAAVDAFGIGMGLVGVGVPLVAPLALLTFFGGFVPIIGATVAGIAAVLVTLVSGGVTDALIILGVVLAVQQIEGHVLQPLVMRRAVQLHPLAIVIALSAGGVLAGIPGAIAAVPFVAVINRVSGYLAATGKSPRPDQVDADDEDPSAEEARP